ncbi:MULTISPECIES: GNAT family N-acetyltransferase [Curtobacterium]|jgi:RimJ/RimL family protein N-acetyltransferase|uniref:GNAT family N-acetyltransferase n=1 Tax=Curtobacterium TaxID=2034 RepID=UPI0005AC2E09|nr:MULTISPECIES: GNAT family protein [Curtobacterium]KIQ02487.1 GCN5 family acetyltransferase [Curtobacterium flaccumfaciens]MBT1617662.1 GNAT family N-acetyltransferase [Curtobacterium flaccumfaciens pv. poinsettiae]UXZ58992.1 GNAT family N-acetyltransferase [Curtobacterium sp. Arg-1]
MVVVLRPWSLDDAAALLVASRSDPDLATQFPEVGLDDEEHARAHVTGALRFDDHARNWAIVEDGVAVGNVGLSAIEFRHGTAWAHYWVAADARGRGLAARALTSVSSWAFDAGLFRLELGHRTNNPASCRVAAAAGFSAEGIERQKLRYGSERFDVETHARLAIDPVPDLPGFEVRTTS